MKNKIFKGEFAITNEDKYEKYYDTAVVIVAKTESMGDADLGSDDSDAESNMVSLSAIQGVNDGDEDISASLVNEFHIKAKKMSTPNDNMRFLP